MAKIPDNNIDAFLKQTAWTNAACESLTGDASTRKYFRLRRDKQSAILMDASLAREILAPFIRINQHLQQLGLSAPAILARDEQQGLLLLEDFGDDTFSRLLDDQGDAEKLFALGTDVLNALH